MEPSFFGQGKRERPDPPARFVPPPGFAAMWAVYEQERRHKEFYRYLVATGRLNEGERKRTDPCAR